MFRRIAHRKRSALIAGALAVAAAGSLGGIAFAGSFSTRDVPPADPIPARMLSAEIPVPISPVLLDSTNGWVTSDGHDLTAVYAGAAGNDASVGRFVVVRQDLDAGDQTVDSVDTGKTGAIIISSAPLGSSVETSAQVGQLSFSSSGGSTGTLDLGNSDSVEVNAP
jgi:hypothetical protein